MQYALDANNIRDNMEINFRQHQIVTTSPSLSTSQELLISKKFLAAVCFITYDSFKNEKNLYIYRFYYLNKIIPLGSIYRMQPLLTYLQV